MPNPRGWRVRVNGAIQLSKSPDGKPDHGLSVHKDASIQNINLAVLTTARHKAALKTGTAWRAQS